MAGGADGECNDDLFLMASENELLWGRGEVEGEREASEGRRHKAARGRMKAKRMHATREKEISAI